VIAQQGTWEMKVDDGVNWEIWCFGGFGYCAVSFLKYFYFYFYFYVHEQIELYFKAVISSFDLWCQVTANDFCIALLLT
jgi:hypothetical protein